MMKRAPSLLAAASAIAFFAGCQSAGTTSTTTPSANAQAEVTMHSVTKSNVGTDPGHAGQGTALVAAPGHELAAFAEGCFWGSENTFRHVPGVTATAVGYTGGHTDRPTYESVCTHTTGHAETVLVEFDPKVVSYEKLVDTFFATHDPTTKNRQGPDVGDQYRSAIFTFSPEQDRVAHARADVAQKKQTKPITTDIGPIHTFWKAEEYHQQYDEKTGRESCALPGIPPS